MPTELTMLPRKIWPSAEENPVFAPFYTAGRDPEQPPPVGWRRRFQQNGPFFFHRETGLCLLLDELPVPQAQVSKVPRFVQLALLDRCNLSCEFCYVPKSEVQWTFDRLKTLLSSLDRAGVMEVAFGGGEPMLYEPLAELLCWIHDHTGMAAHVTTNGLVVPKGFADKVRNKIGQVRISVDGVRATYQKYRGVDFAQVKQGIEALAGLNIGFNMIATDETLADFNEWLNFAAACNVRDVMLLRLDGHFEKWLSSRARARIPTLIQNAMCRGFTVKTSCNLIPGECGFPACGVGTDFCYIAADGSVHPTSFEQRGETFSSFAQLTELWERWCTEPNPCGGGR